jgi:starch synthase
LSANNRLKICLVSAEYSSLARTGGLADVAASLARHFVQAGHDCRVLVPFREPLHAADLEIEEVAGLQDLELLLGGRSFEYSIVRAQVSEPGSTIYLLRCPELFGESDLYSGADEHLRFILLSRAAIEMCQRLEFAPDIFHCHDWHTALIPIYLKTRYAWDRLFSSSRTVLTIHNIGFQGVFGGGILYETGLSSSPEMLDQEDLSADRINFLKTGIMYADLMTTVSPTYAREILEPEYGMGLETLLQERRGSLVGILNGVDYDEWSPDRDPLIGHAYSSRDMSGKERNKQAVMDELGLQYVFDRPLFGMISSLIYQRGIELIQQVLPSLLEERDFSLAVQGRGEPQHERFFQWLQSQHPARVSFTKGFDNRLAHRMAAASDLLLMPSRYEPCGLFQMYGLRYGTVPVVRATGGLADSVQHFDSTSGTGTGIVFHDFDANGLRWAMSTALDLYAKKNDWRRVVFNGMERDYSWDEQGDLYIKAFRKVLRDRS